MKTFLTRVLFFLFTLLNFFILNFLIASEENNIPKPRILHLSFHQGCINEFNSVANALSLDVETWFIPSLPPKFFDGTSQGNALYNIGHDRAERIWLLHKEYFDKFDIILTSDTTPLSRIFLQNGWSKPLIIWVCNRFDYFDQASLDCEFPDPEYYLLMGNAHQKENVTLIAYTAFEHVYAKKKGIETGSLIISPSAPLIIDKPFISFIPFYIVKNETFFLPPYHNETIFMNLHDHCTDLGIPSYCGRYNGSMDLKDFKGIIHLPYAWSNLAFFENMSLGIPYFIPSLTFLTQLVKQGGYFQNMDQFNLIEEELFPLSEWYCPEHQAIMTYFDSWEDLQEKIREANYSELREKIQKQAQKERKIMLSRWQKVFEAINGSLN